MMKFDKSKVCVAGLHDVPVGTKGWFADSVDEFRDKVLKLNKTNGMFIKMKGQRNCLYVDEVNVVWRFFYPAPEKQYRQFETTEEARVLMGKLIRHKYDTELFMVTTISVEGFSGLSINGYNTDYLWDNFVMDETGEPVGVEV
jgi:hypothetical protein